MSESQYPGDRENELFYKVICLSKEKELGWEEISHKIPRLPRGWYELSRLPLEDRIEFTRAFWLSKLPFRGTEGHLEERLEAFFEELEEVEVYATQAEQNHPFEVHMVYSLKEALGFFQGGPPAPPENIDNLRTQFSQFNLPPDYLAFFEIHDGFSKYTDIGLIKSRDLPQTYSRLQDILRGEVLVRPDAQVIKPESLIPFYESFGLHCYQCFYADWYIEDEMGNVYFSEHDRTISNFLDTSRLKENLAFSTFLNWLIFYLEDIWHL
ncbi:MAG: hypothetical protein S4CHLAM45_05270 [Chlamydiales bacterium]|nr:hypothetical protein [Chlamydiales bacterium]MCH9619932.1 hypothetical protein [Chlamydiales bacterium]MCH9622641.1 hypothetical protein [Chlamydiales bacterium]